MRSSDTSSLTGIWTHSFGLLLLHLSMYSDLQWHHLKDGGPPVSRERPQKSRKPDYEAICGREWTQRRTRSEQLNHCQIVHSWWLITWRCPERPAQQMHPTQNPIGPSDTGRKMDLADGPVSKKTHFHFRLAVNKCDKQIKCYCTAYCFYDEVASAIQVHSTSMKNEINAHLW